MERKIQNSQLMHKEKRRACSVQQSNGPRDKFDLPEQNSDKQRSSATQEQKSKPNNFEKQKKISYCSSTATPRTSMPGTSEDALKAELLRCKRELSEYNDASNLLEQKYMKINVELSEMQQRHDHFLTNRDLQEQHETECSMRHQHKAMMPRGGSGILTLTGQCGNSRVLDEVEGGLTSTTIPNHREGRSKAGENLASNFDAPEPSSFHRLPHKTFSYSSDMDKIYEALKENSILKQEALIAPPKANLNGNGDGGDGVDDLRHLQKTVLDLHKEQTHFCNIIQQQRSCLRHYRERLDKMKRIMESQEHEIEKLRRSRRDLQAKVDSESSHRKFDDKHHEVSSLSHKLRDVQTRYEEVVKQNRVLDKRVRALQAQAKEMKAKIEDLNNRKVHVLDRLKNAERDLRVLRNYNASLKSDRQKKIEEISQFREQLEEQKMNSKRALTRQRDTSDRYCRELQQRIASLEQKLGRSNNSTSGALQQREKLILELQTQIATLAKNFEASQKRIRVLRRQISNAAGHPANVAAKNGHRKT